MGGYYANPLSYGIGTGSNKPAFGSGLYNVAATSAIGTLGTTGRTGVGGTASINTNNQQTGFATTGMMRTPTYTTQIDFAYAGMPVAERIGGIQRSLAQSERLPSRGSIRVGMDGGVVVLRGEVESERERQLAEAMARLSGTYDLRNELTVRAAAHP
jgi:osmotically-inducible protein OsmY